MLEKENQIRPDGMEAPTIPKVNKLSRPPAPTDDEKDSKDKEKDKGESKTEEYKAPPPIVIENKNQLIYYKRQELGRTVSGLPVYYITISRENKFHKKKPTIIITSRVH
eukprot:CAMPEP_0176342166 /NCGR_PEP_ID=MMETSP0126-20121128/2968_1 /TAXON_ID=141414 ORGANISM="Strombidinopsis acuminatum, Strain SPMC142" /NCGR_SAMPLE_ID=MMETSP0126 /ASSEMBLY_ACC=CAM_ASM_000229 /LENGTH=108 /DNA_ID=CAMNT_0017687435 /DNA_START=784 /DNA_END=1110 /DNA_ORIENTATION=+